MTNGPISILFPPDIAICEPLSVRVWGVLPPPPPPAPVGSAAIQVLPLYVNTWPLVPDTVKLSASTAVPWNDSA